MPNRLGQFKKGETPWNKGVVGLMRPNSGSFKKGQIPVNKIGTLKICQICSKEYPVKGKYRRENSKYCSRECQAEARVGTVGARKGVKIGFETREKMRQAKLGIRGEAHWNWRPWTKQSRRDRVYFRDTMQKKVFERDQWQCTQCKSKTDLQVDHIKQWAKYPELRFDESNCRTLCAKCHYRVTFNRDMPDNVKAWGHNMSQRVA